MAKAAVRNGCDLVLVSGGDGTVNEAVNGLVGTQTALGTTPVGTGNMRARQLGFDSHTLANPFRFPEVADSLAHGTVRTVDVGIANGRYFLCGTGIG
ncbi:MAG: diacylglycerol kinase family lipid kinase, partial [Anaerolineae bacterium]|nr:diacylglycerol kinase family lipid kinase [Anaerolineae bacterium]